MSRDQESVIDIVNSVKRILRDTFGVSREELSDNDEKLSAILYQITVLAKRLKDCLTPFGNGMWRFLGEKWPECGTLLSMNMTS